MSKVRAAINNTMAVIAAVTPTTVFNGNKAFRHVRQPRDGRSDAARTRQFNWELNGEFEWSGDQMAVAYSSALKIGLDVIITYPTPDEDHELLIVVAEDVELLAKALVDPGDFDETNTGLWRRTFDSFSVDPGNAKGDTTYVTLKLTLEYSTE